MSRLLARVERARGREGGRCATVRGRTTSSFAAQPPSASTTPGTRWNWTRSSTFESESALPACAERERECARDKSDRDVATHHKERARAEREIARVRQRPHDMTHYKERARAKKRRGLARGGW